MRLRTFFLVSGIVGIAACAQDQLAQLSPAYQPVANDRIATEIANAERPPAQCYDQGADAGTPVSFHQGAIMDPPVLVERQFLRVRAQPVAGRSFYCAAFSFAVDETGRVTDVLTLYNSHPGLNGINFAQEAEQILRGWRYQPGLVDKAPAKYTGLSTVFYYGFGG